MRNIPIRKIPTVQPVHSTSELRWLPSAVIAVVVACLFSLAAPAAKADTWNFSLTDPGNTTNINFSFDTTATSTGYDGAYFQMDSPVNWFLNGVDQGSEDLSFWNISNGGGFLLGYVLNLWGPQLYTGTESAPTFIEGTFEYYNTYTPYDGNFTLTVTDPAPVSTPEPSSMLLLGTGILGMLGLTVYRRRRNGLANPGLA